uniref:Uncharacterized protein n=1 Tax=Globisporangium ultimum (strain ATCC 200006 / CBS 805.95 / DAOM BR144) TaxID=431595 RepID=K3W975_GLOUD
MLAPSSKTVLACAVAALVAAPAAVNAHGYMSVPKVTFSISGDTTQFCGTIDGPSTLTAPTGMSFTTDPASNTAAFTKALANSSYTSVRELVEDKGVFITGATKTCGITEETEDPQPLPAKYVEWSHSSTEGFTASHQGPCEVWCDDNLAFSDENCAADYTTAPAQLPYDRTKCLGTSLLKIVWLALHSSTWQIYINCATLETTTASSSTSSAVASSTGSESASEATTEPTSASASTTTDDEYSTSSTTTDEYSSASTTSDEYSSASTTTDEYSSASTSEEISTPAPTPSTTKKCTAKTSRKRRN